MTQSTTGISQRDRAEADFKPSTSRRHALDWAFAVLVFIATLAGVPSIIYGLLGLALFVNYLGPITGGKSVLSGALTLTLLILPVIIIATREALRAIPDTVREGGFALGATRWEVVRSHLLPMALPGALTGTILA